MLKRAPQLQPRWSNVADQCVLHVPLRAIPLRVSPGEHAPPAMGRGLDSCEPSALPWPGHLAGTRRPQARAPDWQRRGSPPSSEGRA
eukprot:scaffold167116_cov30-Tisochrysis_lutea.AAC.6